MTNTKTQQESQMMSIDEIHEHLESEGVSVRAFWREAMDGDRAPLPRRTVEDVRASLCSTDD